MFSVRLNDLFPISALKMEKICFSPKVSIQGAKLDSKIGLYFTHRNGPIFRAKTDLSDLQCVHL